jgi:hypothetical protein
LEASFVPFWLVKVAGKREKFMNIIVEPILKDLRAIYHLQGVMERYWAYVNLMTKARGELLPLGDFSPMGKRQAEFLDALLEMQAEEVARLACDKMKSEISSSEVFRVMLVVVDEPKNGWTHRYLTDAEWRFTARIQDCSKPAAGKRFDRWVSVNIWTTDDQLKPSLPTTQNLERLIRSAVFRAHLQMKHGYPMNLSQMMRQEGLAMRFAGESVDLEISEIERIGDIIEPLVQSEDFPTNFAALYGDDAAISVGYKPLGLSQRAGFKYGYHVEFGA